jgi:hypothetical protein
MSGFLMTPRRYTFKTEREDYEALLKRLDARPVSISLILAGAIATGLAWGMVDPGWYGELALLPLIGAMALALFAAVHLFRRLRRAYRLSRWRPPAEPTEIEVFDDHLAVRENGKTRACPWAAFAGATLDEARVYLMVSRRDVLVVPRSAFGTADEMRAFALDCRERLSEPGPAEAAADAAPAKAPPGAPLPEASGIRLGVDVSLTPEDNELATRDLRDQAKGGAPTGLPQAALAAGLAGGLVAGGACWLAAGGLDPQARLAAAAGAAWAGAIVLTFLGARRIESARAEEWPADDPRRMRRRIEIDEAGLVSHGADFETRIAWAGVDSIRETEHNVLFITRWKEIYAVPKRCFTDANAGHAFVSKARAFKSARLETAS